jgi:hypothetical protein
MLEISALQVSAAHYSHIEINLVVSRRLCNSVMTRKMLARVVRHSHTYPVFVTSTGPYPLRPGTAKSR